MSINHLIDSATDPRYDIYVNDVDCKNIGVENINASVSVTAPDITATNELLIAEQNNYNDILQITPFALNSFLFDEGDNDFVNLSDLFQYLKSRKVGSSGTIDTYKFNWTGENTALGDDAVFDFRAINSFDSIIDVKGFAQWDISRGNNDVGVEIGAPLNPANDFQVQLNTDVTGSLSAGDTVIFTLEIQLYRNP